MMTNIDTYSPSEHLVKIKSKDGTMKDYYPASWRLFELSLRYPNANFSSDLVHVNEERDFVIVKARLYLGASYETSDKKAEAFKQGKLSMLDKVETAAKARAARDFGIGTEHALDFEDATIEGGIVDSPVMRHNANLNGNVSQSNSSQKSLRIEAGKESATSAGQVNDKSGQHFDKARLQALYHAGKNAGLLNGEGWTALFEWASSTLKREVNRPSELTIEEIVQLETIVKPEAAQHA